MCGWPDDTHAGTCTAVPCAYARLLRDRLQVDNTSGLPHCKVQLRHFTQGSRNAFMIMLDAFMIMLDAFMIMLDASVMK